MDRLKDHKKEWNKDDIFKCKKAFAIVIASDNYDPHYLAYHWLSKEYLD